MRKKEDYLIMGKGYGKGFAKAAAITYLFYRSIVFSVLSGVLFGIPGIYLERKKEREEQCREITLQFRQGMQSISAALNAGYAIENAFGEAKKDLELLYGKNSLLVQEFSKIMTQLSWNRSIEELLFEFADRWDVEDIRYFAEVFQTAKRTGGDLIAITRSTAEKISEKIEVNREIQTLISGKKMEGRIMNVIPLGMILYFWICSPSFLDCLYTGVGRVVMTILLTVYLAAYQWSASISNIRV